MYNILVFGLKENTVELVDSFSSLSCNFIHINTLSEFYSTAFSRIFDLWIIESAHPDVPEIALPDLLATHPIPEIFIFHAPIENLTSDKITVFQKGGFAKSDPCDRCRR